MGGSTARKPLVVGDSGGFEELDPADTLDGTPTDAELQAIAALVSAADKVPYFTGSGTAALADLTAAARTFIAAVNETAQRAAMGLGSIAVLNAINNSHWSGTVLSAANGGTGQAGTLVGYVKGLGGLGFSASSSIPNTDITGLGTASTANTGTSGGTVPFLSTANTWSLGQTFGLGSGQRLLTINGGNSASSDGAGFYINNAGATVSAFGNYSAIFGGTYDNRTYLYSANNLVISTNGFTVNFTLSNTALAMTVPVAISKASAAAQELLLLENASNGVSATAELNWKLGTVAGNKAFARCEYDATVGFELVFGAGNPAGEVLRLSSVDGRFSIPFGYKAGAGGTITQLTSKGTAVTLHKANGVITLANSALAANTTVTFTLTNNLIAAGDRLAMSHDATGTFGAYLIQARCVAGSATIAVRNVTGGSLSEAIQVGFTLVKGSTS